MSLGLWLNQSGIVIEILGACLVAWQAARAGRSAGNLEAHFGAIADTVQHYIDDVRRRFTDSLYGFGFVVVGLALQLAANAVEVLESAG